MIRRTTLEELEAHALENSAVKAVFDVMAPAYAVTRDMIALRMSKAPTQSGTPPAREVS